MKRCHWSVFARDDVFLGTRISTYTYIYIPVQCAIFLENFAKDFPDESVPPWSCNFSYFPVFSFFRSNWTCHFQVTQFHRESRRMVLIFFFFGSGNLRTLERTLFLGKVFPNVAAASGGQEIHTSVYYTVNSRLRLSNQGVNLHGQRMNPFIRLRKPGITGNSLERRMPASAISRCFSLAADRFSENAVPKSSLECPETDREERRGSVDIVSVERA